MLDIAAYFKMLPLSTGGSSDKQAQRTAKKCERAADIRCRLRYLARLKLKAAERGGYNSLLKSEQLDRVADATKELCVVATDKMLNGTTKFEKLHTALKVGQFLRKICQVCESLKNAVHVASSLAYSKVFHCNSK